MNSSFSFLSLHRGYTGMEITTKSSTLMLGYFKFSCFVQSSVILLSTSKALHIDLLTRRVPPVGLNVN